MQGGGHRALASLVEKKRRKVSQITAPPATVLDLFAVAAPLAGLGPFRSIKRTSSVLTGISQKGHEQTQPFIHWNMKRSIPCHCRPALPNHLLKQSVYPRA